MKKLVFILSIILTISNANADCSSNGIYFFPQQEKISLNSKFIITGYYHSQKIIESFKSRKIYLKSEKGENIELILENTFIGQMHLTQALFRPAKELKPNTKYYLKLQNQTKTEEAKFTYWNRNTKKHERKYWITTSTKSCSKINTNISFVFKEYDVAYYGCGPAAYALFTIKNRNSGEIWCKTEVMDLTSTESTTYILNTGDETISIGHGMCSGEFTFRQKGKYKVRFTPMNCDGVESKTTNWIYFNSPFMNL